LTIHGGKHGSDVTPRKVEKIKESGRPIN